MNSVITDMLTDVSLRDTSVLEEKVTEAASAGLPWLNEE
jgi:hypothetical protein